MARDAAVAEHVRSNWNHATALETVRFKDDVVGGAMVQDLDPLLGDARRVARYGETLWCGIRSRLTGNSSWVLLGEFLTQIV